MLWRNGRYANGKQRWFCQSCKRSYSWNNKAVGRIKEREWFRRWVVEGYSVRQLADQSGHSTSKLYQIINYHVKQKPLSTSGLGRYQHFIMDGTFIHRPCSLIALMDAETHTIILL